MSKRGWILYILSHHGPKNLHRAFEINILDRTVHLCSRCTGIYTGLIFYALAGFKLPDFPRFLLMISFTLPILFDWTIQTLEIRESRNPIRMVTGFLFGISLWIFVSFLSSGFSFYSISSLFYLFLVYLILYLIHLRTDLMDNYISSKFEGSEPPWEELAK